MQVNQEQLEAHLAKGEYEQAGALFGQALSEISGADDEASALIEFAELYTTVSNTIDEEYQAGLEVAVVNLIKINRAQALSEDKIRLAEVKDSLKMGA